MTTGSPTLERVKALYPSCNLGTFIQPELQSHGASVALIEPASKSARVMTYGALEEEVCRAVGALHRCGVARGERFAIALPNCGEYLIAFLAVMRLGAIPVMVNFRLGLETLKFILEDSESRGVLTDAADLTALAGLAESMRLPVRLSTAAVPGWQEWARLLREAQPDTRVETMAFEDQAFQPYTAGSTGTPKGIALTHGGMLWGIEHNHTYWPRSALSRGIVAAPMYHKNAMRGVIKPTLRAGGSVAILKRFEARSYLRAIAQHRVTACGGVPAMFAQLLREQDLIRSLDFSALEVISMGSSTVPDELVGRVKAAFPRVTVKETYGLTEGGGPLGPPPDRPTPRGSVGTIAPEVEIKLIDASGQVNPREGELWMRSPYVLREYVKRTDLTRERLRDGWLNTGDLFRVDDAGFYYFVGRTDDMFVCGGENIYPKEVEGLILKHPDVSDVIVVPLPHATKGFAPAAMIEPREGRAIEPAALQRYCAENGPVFAIPRVILVVERLPMTGASKPDRNAALTQLRATFGILESRSAAGNGQA